MSFRSILTDQHTRKATDAILSKIKQQPDRIAELMECFFDEDLRLCQRAAWPVGDLGAQFPELILPYLPQLIDNLKKPKHNAIIRNIVRTWQNMKIPEDYQGEIFELCFNYILDPKVPIAIRAFSMTVCANICKDVPELSAELVLAIEDQLENGSPGIRSRGSKILSTLQK